MVSFMAKSATSIRSVQNDDANKSEDWLQCQIFLSRGDALLGTEWTKCHMGLNDICRRLECPA